MQIGFSILHYQAYEMTIKCVESILKYVKNPLIVIVDNNSNNKSGKKLKEYFNNFENITIILNQKNYGFSGGNNIGYLYLKNHYQCDYICCINNDTLLCSDNFTSIIQTSYNDYNFDIMAPLVFLKDGSVQCLNPVLQDINHYKKRLKLYENCENIDEYHNAQSVLYKLKIKMPNSFRLLRKIKQLLFRGYLKTQINVVLHCCFIVFSRDYIKNFDTAFEQKTFLFNEEEFLYIRALKNNLKTLYEPRLKIVHLEDVATDSIVKNKEEKYKFIRLHQMNSLKVLINELETINKENNL